MPTGIPKSGINKGWFKKGEVSLNKGNKLSDYEKREISRLTKLGMTKEVRERLSKIKTEQYYPKQTSSKKGLIAWNYIDGMALKRKRYAKLTKINWFIANHIHRVPEGCVIHHIDQNPMNNSPENLQLMTRDFHNILHATFLKSMKGSDLVNIR